MLSFRAAPKGGSRIGVELKSLRTSGSFIPLNGEGPGRIFAGDVITSRHAMHIINWWKYYSENFFGEGGFYEFLSCSMHEALIKTGNGLTKIKIDWNEFKWQQPCHDDLIRRTLSNYKKTYTQNFYLIFPIKMLYILFNEIYSGPISGSGITEKSNVIS